MQPLMFDIRDALRGFRRDRAYAATVVLTLALTIGATTAVFSIVNGVLLQPLSYPQPERLVAVREVWRQRADRVGTMEVNERHFEYWRARTSTFESMAQYRITSGNLTGTGDAAQIVLARSSGSLFEVLRQEAAIGRTLASTDDPEGAPDVVTISDSLWRQRFAADPGVVGRPMVLDGRTYTLIGVLRPDFHLPDDSQPVDAFVPIRVNVGWVGDHNDQAIGRLRPGVAIDRARAELDLFQKQVSELASNESHEPVILSSAVTPLAEHVVGTARRGLLLLLGAIAGVLLIACSNLANLALTRTLGQAREAAIRSALGASRRRLLARTLLEQLLLSATGGLLGLWIAWLGLGFFVRTAPIDLPRVKDVALDTRVLAFAAAISMLTGLLVAIVPALRSARRDTQATLRAGAMSVTGDRSARRSHAALLGLQVALSVTLLVVTTLLGTSLLRVLSVDRGFTSAQVLAVDLALPGTRYADEPVRQAAYDRLIAAVRAIPGVQSASTTSLLPLRAGQSNFIVPQGSTLPIFDHPSANFRFVAPEFFRTLGVTILHGRSFADTERDPQRPAPALVSQPVAARLWPGEEPIGKRFSRGIPNEQGFEVVGVVTDARLTSLDRTPPLMVYLPYWWRSRPATSLLIKTAVDPSAIVASVRRAVSAVDPEIAVGQSRPLDDLVEAAVAGRRYQARLFVAFGLVALFIAMVGVYAVTSHAISRRRREMNIRVALGAPVSQVVGLILRQATRPVLAGLVVGTIGALALGSVVASLLFQVRARDPLIVGAVVFVVGSISIATSLVATRRRLAVDPASALREE
jgi:putative ABC transport system permease protein